ncbi:hypothetical protein [Streptomyces sp. G1]|uniref:hypothetical protein n=1 Tax=Streptomyces sp. G1 TaxID=361572 RepID=UPI00202DCA54|nr:hypothetical protein [Streptomyces sp. G1]MCM1976803.1 hypothetical protein [Streptomyces sp. G1]
MSTHTAPVDMSLLGAYNGGPCHEDVDAELRMAARVLESTATASVHDQEDMIRSAVALRIRLVALAAAVNAERGEGR